MTHVELRQVLAGSLSVGPPMGEAKRLEVQPRCLGWVCSQRRDLSIETHSDGVASPKLLDPQHVDLDRRNAAWNPNKCQEVAFMKLLYNVKSTIGTSGQQQLLLLALSRFCPLLGAECSSRLHTNKPSFGVRSQHLQVGRLQAHPCCGPRWSHEDSWRMSSTRQGCLGWRCLQVADQASRLP